MFKRVIKLDRFLEVPEIKTNITEMSTNKQLTESVTQQPRPRAHYDAFLLYADDSDVDFKFARKIHRFLEEEHGLKVCHLELPQTVDFKSFHSDFRTT